MKTQRLFWRAIVIALSLTARVVRAEEPGRYALLIASGEFVPRSSFKPLRAPANDVRLLASLLEWRFGFRRENLYIVGVEEGAVGKGYHYEGRYATFAAIQRGFRWLAQRVRADDYAVIYYSGHGTQIFDLSGDEPDLNDEALVTYEGTEKSLVLDDHINDWLKDIKSKRVTLLFDCCYSGSIARDPRRNFGAAKFVPMETRSSITRSPGLAEKNILPKDSPYTLLSACRSNEQAEEVLLTSSPPERPQRIAVSAFTWALYQTLCWKQSSLTNKDLRERVISRLRRLERPQTPQQEGGNERGIAIAPAVGEARVPRIPVTGGELGVGWLAGVRKGMVFVGDETGSAPLMQVTASDWFTAAVRSSAFRRLPAFAVPRVIPTPSLDVPVRVRVAGKGKPLPSNLLQAPDGFEIVQRDDGQVDLDLTVTDDEGRYQVEVVRSNEQVMQTFTAQSLAELVQRLEDVLRAFQLQRQLQTWDNPIHPFGLEVSSDRGAVPTYRVGDMLQFDAQADEDGCLLLLAIEPDGEAHVLFPNDYHADNQIIAGRRYRVPSEEMNFRLRAQPPAGDTVVIAILSKESLTPPNDLLTPPPKAGRAPAPRSIAPTRRKAFLDWLTDVLRPALAKDVVASRSIGVAPAEPLTSAAAVDVAVMVVRVEEKEE